MNEDAMRFLIIIQKIIQIPSFFFSRPPDLALSFAGMKTGCLEFYSFQFFFRSDVNIIFYGFSMRHSFFKQSRYFDPPAFGFCFYFIFITNTYIL